MTLGYQAVGLGFVLYTYILGLCVECLMSKLFGIYATCTPVFGMSSNLRMI